MRISSITAALAVSLFTLTSCVVVDENGNLAGVPAPLPNRLPLTYSTMADTVTIREGANFVSAVTAAFPNIEQARWANGQTQIVVKSRGNHGPATVQLFNSRTGREEGRVMAYEIRNGFPVWAAGMGE